MLSLDMYWFLKLAVQLMFADKETWEKALWGPNTLQRKKKKKGLMICQCTTVTLNT